MINYSIHQICDAIGGQFRGDADCLCERIRGISIDSRKILPNQLYIPIIGDKFDGHDFIAQSVENGAICALWQSDRALPALPELPIIIVEDTESALQTLAAHYRQTLGATVVAITGSNGKTTTKDILAHLLSACYKVHKTKGNLNNHLGLPLTLLAAPEDSEILVMELGMNHAGEISQLSKIARPDIAIITNIGESHIEHLGSREAIAAAKFEIIDGMGLDSQGIMFYDGDEPLLRDLIQGSSSVEYYSIGNSITNKDYPINITYNGWRGSSFCSSSTGTLFQVPLLGKHNIYNSLLAIAVARRLQLHENEIAEQLSSLSTNTDRRLQSIEGFNGMSIIDDTYNASPASMRAALDLVSTLHTREKTAVLLGDMNEIGELSERYHREVGRYAMELGISHVYTIGQKAKWISQEIWDHDLNSTHFKNQEQAIEQLRDLAAPDLLLLVKASRALQLDLVVQALCCKSFSVRGEGR